MIATLSISGVDYSVYSLTTDALADANGYFKARLGADDWDAAGSTDKKKALVSAARWLDRMTWASTPTSTSQALAHPRASLTDCDGVAVLDTDVAPGIAEAQFELALVLLGDAAAQESSGTGSNVKKVEAGSAKVTFFSSSVGSNRDTRLPQIAHDLVKCYFGNSSGAGIASGSGETSKFSDTDFGLNNGHA